MMTLNKTDGLDTEINSGAEASVGTEMDVDTVVEPKNPVMVQPISLRNSALPLSWAKTDHLRTGRQPVARKPAQRDWYMLAIVLLILASAALCFRRLMWAIQP